MTGWQGVSMAREWAGAKGAPAGLTAQRWHAGARAGASWDGAGLACLLAEVDAEACRRAHRLPRPCKLAGALTAAELLASRTTLQRVQPGALPELQHTRRAGALAITAARAGAAGRRRRCRLPCAQARKRPRARGAPRARARAPAAPPAAPLTRSPRWRRRLRPPRSASRRSCTREAVCPSGRGALLLDFVSHKLCAALCCCMVQNWYLQCMTLLHVGSPCGL